ncbi:transketolase [Acidimicrobium ferrooxidans DSM 10331]|uniref:Transketolase n=1 Tax=Acidimicrobium ferrooxidans (strain DSM 10331 / JCM 15462 / NBRC 103882 / ICP) TaxID=525909 RepID=C7M237_ACIFD|nr:transketolase [Acidimicrobium ferrooxidans]ACU53135.1 transketolase [Acidimicrobium ferrooxidans DSM 10331]
MTTTVEQRAITTVRMLSIDQVEAANSGHPGLPLGLSPVAVTIFARLMRFDPTDPAWPNRDRFVLSAGHGSAMLYSLLHLFGFDLPMDELRRFRQLNSRTPGHPEYGHTAGVEVTTGPLGQGFATAVGLALAEQLQRHETEQRFGEALIDHHTFVLASDGDLMEGISHEAASLAGHLGLGRLIVGYDSNDITIDGPAHISCTDDVRERFRGYGWQVLSVEDTEDPDAIEAVYRVAMADESRPSLIILPTLIGRGAPTKQGTSKVHGAALGPDEYRATKEFYGWPVDEAFVVPDDVRAWADEVVAAKREVATKWRERAREVGYEAPSIHLDPQVLEALEFPEVDPAKAVASRVASQHVLERAMVAIPTLVGGSADLAESTGTKLALPVIDREHPLGRIVHFGIREHAMAACANGLALSGLRPWVATFLVFSDYLRPSFRLSAIMGLPVIYLFTHDSIGVGEDGPTHQPIEQVEALRIIPNSAVVRPADAFETNEAWAAALAHTSGPIALILTRQGLAPMPTADEPGWLERRGARIVYGADVDRPDVVLVASGSEVNLCVEAAHALLEEEGIVARVVSVPWRERFLAIDEQEREELAPSGIPRLIVEASVATGWEAFLQPGDRLYNITRFGLSAPIKDVQRALGFTASDVADAAAELVVDGSFLRRPVHLVSELLAATEAAAVATQDLVGDGDRSAADQAAVSAMRRALGALPARATVIVGEGEKDRAPMLYVGERLGSGSVAVDLAVDPLEGTTYAATGREGAVSVLAAAPNRGLHPLPGWYMEKLVVPAEAAGVVDIEAPLVENVRRVAHRLGLAISETPVVVLAKPRHEAAIRELRAARVPVVEIPDGDVMASLRVLTGDPRMRMLWGIGGTPEGVITAAAALALAGQMQARLRPQSDEERSILDAWKPDWEELRFEASDLAHPESVVVASSVTGATPLVPPMPHADGFVIESLWIEPGQFGTVRRVVSLRGEEDA